jgi:hypothetical protein
VGAGKGGRPESGLTRDGCSTVSTVDVLPHNNIEEGRLSKSRREWGKSSGVNEREEQRKTEWLGSSQLEIPMRTNSMVQNVSGKKYS